MEKTVRADERQRLVHRQESLQRPRAPRAAERLAGLVRPRNAVIRQVATEEPKTVGARGTGARAVSAHAELAIREIVVEPVVEAQALEEAAQVDVDGGEELAVYERLRVVRIVRLLAGSLARRDVAPRRGVVRRRRGRARTHFVLRWIGTSADALA